MTRPPDWINLGHARPCADCLKAVNGLGGEITLHSAQGWTDLVERAWRNRYNDEVERSKITIRNVGTFPLAG